MGNLISITTRKLVIMLIVAFLAGIMAGLALRGSISLVNPDRSVWKSDPIAK